jgi:hypothetical protein
MATQFGTASPFGIPNDQTGIIIDGRTDTYSQEKKQIRDKQGKAIGSTYYDERCEVSVGGFLPTSTPFSGTLASAITLGTSIVDHFIGSVSGSTIVEGITRTLSSEEYSRIEITAINNPGIAS